MLAFKLDDLEPFVTADGSTIREIAGIGRDDAAASRQQSLAEATVPPGGQTLAHDHRAVEELYLFVAGRGRLRLGDEQRDVAAGDCVVIPPGVVHKLWSSVEGELVLLCACAPPYTHEDTVLVEDAAVPAG
jgi:mannose-6-phosphate isomerase-like protein (cupin superfamily)